MKGRISSFESLGTVDGPGVRNVVFMQGCPLRCACCHNPETWDVNGGKETDSIELSERILRYRNYFGPEGGVTVSGGEPLLQASFVAELFSILKKAGINTALDTSGCLWNEDVERLLSVTDLVLLDHKFATEEDYVKYTKGSLKRTEDFLSELQKRNIPTWIRRVIIPGINDDEASSRQLLELEKRFSCIKKTEPLPFRKLCLSKYESLGIDFPLKDVREADEGDIAKVFGFY